MGRTLPSSSSSSALSRGKPSVSSKRTPLLHEPLSRLLPSPSTSSPLLSPRGSQHLSVLRLLLSSSSSASSQPKELPKEDPQPPGLLHQPRSGPKSQEV